MPAQLQAPEAIRAALQSRGSDSGKKDKHPATHHKSGILNP